MKRLKIRIIHAESKRTEIWRKAVSHVRMKIGSTKDRMLPVALCNENEIETGVSQPKWDTVCS